MDAKQKARELVAKYLDINSEHIIDKDGLWDKFSLLSTDEAKQCALICVDEIIDSHYKVFKGAKASVNDYWQDVKREINKL